MRRANGRHWAQIDPYNDSFTAKIMSNIDSPKIIIDEDWKSQVEAEKAAARNEKAEPAGNTAGTADKKSRDATEPSLPPATFSFLLTTLATQAMIALGQIPNPITAKVDPRPRQAKHYIDTLAMLEEKSQNNRTAEETMLLTEILHQLRMGYVSQMNSKGI